MMKQSVGESKINSPFYFQSRTLNILHSIAPVNSRCKTQRKVIELIIKINAL